MWNGIPVEDGRPADFVLGQKSFSSTFPGAGAGGLAGPTMLACTPNRLLVDDPDNSRILIWTHLPITANGQPAAHLVGQSDMNGTFAGTTTSRMRYPERMSFDGTRLVVADRWNARVMIWNELPSSDGVSADVVLREAKLPMSASEDYLGPVKRRERPTPRTASFQVRMLQ